MAATLYNIMDTMTIMRDKIEVFLRETVKKMDCKSVGDLSTAKCSLPLKNDVAKYLHGALVLLDTQNKAIGNLLSSTGELQHQLIKSQRSVIELQEQLLDSKDRQLQSLQTTVKSSVEDTVKEQFKSYSEAVKTQQCHSQSLTPETLTTVVRKVVEREDRSRNFMIFGLPEGEDEKLDEKVADVLQKIGEKPRLDACRIGGGRVGGKDRPVKVTLISSAIISQILRKSRDLKETEQYKTVFISPDLNYEERTKQRELILELKKRNAETPAMKHYIRGGKVLSVERV